jgi:hypothetical protein
MLMPIVLAALLRLILVTENWLMCAGIYALARAMGGLLYSRELGESALWAGAAFVVSALYFWLLTHMSTPARWWTVAILGFPLFLL